MKGALVPTGASTIKDPTVALSVASAISFLLDKVAYQAEPDVVSIALAAQSTILAAKQITEIYYRHCDVVELIGSLKVEVATEQNKAKSAIADLVIIMTKAEAKEKKAEEECAKAVVEEEKANHVDLLWRAAEETTNVAEEEKAKYVDLLRRSAEERAKVIDTALAKAKEEIEKLKADLQEVKQAKEQADLEASKAFEAFEARETLAMEKYANEALKFENRNIKHG